MTGQTQAFLNQACIPEKKSTRSPWLIQSDETDQLKWLRDWHPWMYLYEVSPTSPLQIQWEPEQWIILRARVPKLIPTLQGNVSSTLQTTDEKVNKQAVNFSIHKSDVSCDVLQLKPFSVILPMYFETFFNSLLICNILLLRHRGNDSQWEVWVQVFSPFLDRFLIYSVENIGR